MSNLQGICILCIIHHILDVFLVDVAGWMTTSRGVDVVPH